MRTAPSPHRLLAAALLLAVPLAPGVAGRAAEPPAGTGRTVPAGPGPSSAAAPRTSPQAAGAAAPGAPPPAGRTQVIGIIGGVSWVSSLEYYRLMNQMVRDRLGPLHSANVLMYSIEFGTFSEQERLAEAGDWRPLRETMRAAARRLKDGGADFVVIASNTMNSSADDIERNVGIPVLRIMDATGQRVREKGLRRVALLGTKYTMENPFWRDHAERRYGIQVVTPTPAERDYVNRVIFDELCADVIRDESRQGFVRIIERLVREEHVEGVVLGCTEIPLLVKQKDVSVPVFDTTAIHSEAAVRRSLGIP